MSTASHTVLVKALTARNLMDIRHEICRNFTGRMISSLSELTDDEATALVSDLRTDEAFGRVDFSNARHRYILSICYQIGWTKMHPRLGRLVADNARLGRWVKMYGKYKKPILQHTPAEIGAIIKAMEMMLNNTLK